ncbi:DUF1553 domain-containing protein [Seonamhaeicola maritimus]|uniref:DUF1553 domain-containing protein n=1 Tax=Seonamhaeicola maritimus TaxID=2591822 RepID=A0A5C7GJ65_9FLAO|nr:DUF1553 domain-containing protein [Seonamhaeicola maritimus]TXG38372.1 DUF1553 domain-containing protein [Seonamhaeicola maritimus]
MRNSALAFIVLMLVYGCGWKAPDNLLPVLESTPGTVDFNYHIKPILSDKCFACHGPDVDNQKSDLRLDTPEHAYMALGDDKIHAIVPGKPGKSHLIDRILSSDSETVMPPPDFNLTLTDEEKALLIKWVYQGAEYKPHWSFIKPEKSKLSDTKHKIWTKNDIDNYVAANLDRHNLEPSEVASKETLIRRLSFDLTGLPPTIEQMESFANDASDDAYENLVDELLSSSAYGERMAADWMDVARYADSDGYLDDKHRDFSPYRDWVIKAFNQNMSYEEFVTKQLAGDLIPNANVETVLPTAFNRLHKKNSEAGIVFEEFRAEYVADRTATMSKAFLGLTVECARCHDHKYDPISQKDHFKLAAFFNSTNEIGTAVYGPDQTPGPSLLLTNKEQQQIIDFLEGDIDDSSKKLADIMEEGTAYFENWLKTSNAIIYKSISDEIRKSLTALYNFDKFKPQGKNTYLIPAKNNIEAARAKEPVIKEGQEGKGLFLNDFTSFNLPKKVGYFDHTDPFSVSISIFPNKVYEDAMVFNHCEDIRNGYKGYSLHLEDNHLKFIMAFSWPSNAIQITSKEPIKEKEWANITISYDGSGTAEGLHLFKDGDEIPVNIDMDHLYKSMLFKWNIHTYGFHGFRIGRRDGMRSFVNGGIDNLKIFNKELSAIEVKFLEDKNEVKNILVQKETDKNRALLADYYFVNVNNSTKEEKENLQQLKKKLTAHVDSIPEIMVLGDLPEPRPTFVLDRGQYDSPTEEVFAGVPDAILPFDKNLPKNRLGLTKWLFDKEHPLTARVFVNRIWQMHFGSGLVDTADDFGNQGSLPSHPELLDYLAVSFMESGWDIKALHKQIVMSATYQQNSKADDNLLEIDPENILLARGPSFRLPAEMIRDNALAISGLLSDKIGGSSVYPYQPEGLWDELSNKKWRYKYLQEPGEGLYRRSLYTVWKRTSPPPSMSIFDVADRGTCAVKRRQTSTPLQALVLLNDPQFIEAGRVLAEDLMSRYKNDTIRQLEHAFKLGTGRTPEKDELAILQKFYNDEVGRFGNEKDNAMAYLNIGQSTLKRDSNYIQTAALATVVNGIMNTTDAYMLR